MWMLEHLDELRRKEILHFAQERSLRRWLDRNHIATIIADLYLPADLQLDIQDTGLEDSSWDVIICNHVMEHVQDYKRALRKLYRIVRPGGMILISFPVDRSLRTVYEDETIKEADERRKNFGQSDHLRVFGRDSTELLESFGFMTEEIRGEDYDSRIKPVIGPADYDYNVLWRLTK